MLEHVGNLFMFIGGLGMFLYGMHVMADGMQKSAGNKMKDFLGMLTGNRFMAVGIGALIIMFAKSNKKQNIAEIIIGVGLLFLGLKSMSGAIKPYTDAPIFSIVFTTLGYNPILGILAGAVITALLQSSSVSVGILQTLAVNGLVGTNAAVFITLGENIGSCVTALLSAMGGSRTAKRAATIHLSFNVIGAILFGVICTVLFMVRPDIAGHKITPVEISLFHTGFKLTMTVLLFPFAEKLVDLSGFLIKETEADRLAAEAEGSILHLDPRIFEQPSIAVVALSNEVVRMGEMVLENVRRAVNVCFSRDEKEIEKVFEVEKRVNRINKELTEYLIHANNLSLNNRQKLIVANLFNSLTDIERSGDHAENITEQVQLLIERNQEFSELGHNDLLEITAAVDEAFDGAIQARKTSSKEIAVHVGECEDKVDQLRDDLKVRHIDRLSRGECDPAAGIVFIEIVDNLERISDHAENLAQYVLKELG